MLTVVKVGLNQGSAISHIHDFIIIIIVMGVLCVTWKSTNSVATKYRMVGVLIFTIVMHNEETRDTESVLLSRWGVGKIYEDYAECIH